jgi:hypothetical protein
VPIDIAPLPVIQKWLLALITNAHATRKRERYRRLSCVTLRDVHKYVDGSYERLRLVAYGKPYLDRHDQEALTRVMKALASGELTKQLQPDGTYVMVWANPLAPVANPTGRMAPPPEAPPPEAPLKSYKLHIGSTGPRIGVAP